MGKIPVQKGIPIPEARVKYPLASMNVGDSIFTKKNISNNAYQYGKVHDMKFTTRKTDNGFRTWRVK